MKVVNRWRLSTVHLGPLGAGGGVETDGGGRREVETLRAAIQRYPYPPVGRVRHGAGQPVRLRAEQPRGPAAQLPGVGQPVEVGVAGRVGPEYRESGGADRKSTRLNSSHLVTS